MKWLLSIFLCMIFIFPVYADTASSSDAAIDPDQEEVIYDDSELRDIHHEVVTIRNILSGPEAYLASDSNAEGMEGNTYPYQDSSGFLALDSLQGKAYDPDIFLNVLRYDVTFNGNRYVLLFPPEYVDSLYIDAENRLWNMSTSTVTGRAVSANFDPLAITGQLFYLTPCLGNNFSTVNSYGSPNYMRNYYWSSGRLTYDTVYGTIYVDQYHPPFYVSQTLDYILLFFVIGGVLILWLSSFKHY